jgi:hypothetical protein
MDEHRFHKYSFKAIREHRKVIAAESGCYQRELVAAEPGKRVLWTNRRT